MDDDVSAVPTAFEFDLSVYRLSALKKAAYRFTSQFSIQIEKMSDVRARITLLPRRGVCPTLDPHTLPVEVLDQELRELVGDETKSIRELLLAQTFSELSLVDPVGESAEYHDDPLDITGQARFHNRGVG